MLLWFERPQFGGQSHSIPIIIVPLQLKNCRQECSPWCRRVTDRQCQDERGESEKWCRWGEETGSAWPTGEQQSSCCSPVAFHFSPFASFFPSQPEARRCRTCFSATERKKQSPRLVAAVRFDLPSSQRDNWFGTLDASVFIVWGRREHKREEEGWLGVGGWRHQLLHQ